MILEPIPHNIGCVLQDSGEFKQALEAFEQSLQIRREIEDYVGVATTLNNLARLAVTSAKAERAPAAPADPGRRRGLASRPLGRRACARSPCGLSFGGAIVGRRDGSARLV